MRLDGRHTPEDPVPRCPTCIAFLQPWRGDRGRCPWTRPTDPEPDAGHWACGWPKAKPTDPSLVPAFTGEPRTSR